MDEQNYFAQFTGDEYLEDEHPDVLGCPACESVSGVRWRGGDSVVNLGGALMTRVDWYECDSCGYKWSESYDHE